MFEPDDKTLQRLFLSPFFILERVFGKIVPGLLLLLLLALKGNRLLTNAWMLSSFGYKTKIIGALVFSYLIGTVLRLPFNFRNALKLKQIRSKQAVDQAKENLTDLAIQSVAEAAIYANPILADQIASSSAEVSFQIGTGLALIVAGFIPGDGLQLLELVLGLMLLIGGGLQFQEHQRSNTKAAAIGVLLALAQADKQKLEAILKAITAISDKGAEPIAFLKSFLTRLTEKSTDAKESQTQ